MSTIYVNKTATANFYSGEFYLNNCAGTNAVINAYGDVYIHVNNFYLGNSIGAGVYSTYEAPIHIVGDISNIKNKWTLKYISITTDSITYNQGMIVDLIANEYELPTEEEWNKFVLNTAWYNGGSAVTAGTHVVPGYNKADKLFYARVNNSTTAKTVYLNPASGSDTNNGTTKAQAVQTWNHVLTLNPTVVYLLASLDFAGSNVMEGNNITLKRHIDFTGVMIRVVSKEGSLTINNLIIDGNADKDGSVNQFKDYLICEAAITNTSSCTLTLNGVTVKNNATKTNGAGISFKANEANGSHNLILNNSKIINNAIVMDSTISYTTKVYGVGVAIENTDQTKQNVVINLDVNNCDISQNTLVSITGGHDYTESVQSYTRGGMGIGIFANYSNDYVKNINVNIKNSSFAGNQISGTTYYYGSAILFVNSFLTGKFAPW